jgi:hypothetical protein
MAVAPPEAPKSADAPSDAAAAKPESGEEPAA